MSTIEGRPSVSAIDQEPVLLPPVNHKAIENHCRLEYDQLTPFSACGRYVRRFRYGGVSIGHSGEIRPAHAQWAVSNRLDGEGRERKV